MKESLDRLTLIQGRQPHLIIEIIEELANGVAHITGASPEYELDRAIQNVMLEHQYEWSGRTTAGPP